MTSKAARKTAKRNGERGTRNRELPPPVLLYPLHGCENVQDLTPQERVAKLRAHRLMLRKHWNHPGVTALVGILELSTHAMTQEALLRGATEFDRGQAGAGLRMLSSLRAIVTGEEEAEG